VALFHFGIAHGDPSMTFFAGTLCGILEPQEAPLDPYSRANGGVEDARSTYLQESLAGPIAASRTPYSTRKKPSSSGLADFRARLRAWVNG